MTRLASILAVDPMKKLRHLAFVVNTNCFKNLVLFCAKNGIKTLNNIRKKNNSFSYKHAGYYFIVKQKNKNKWKKFIMYYVDSNGVP